MVFLKNVPLNISESGTFNKSEIWNYQVLITIFYSHMGISVMEDERQHIKKVENALSNSLSELGYKSTA